MSVVPPAPPADPKGEVVPPAPPADPKGEVNGNLQAAAARKAFEAEKAKLDAELEQTRKELEAARKESAKVKELEQQKQAAEQRLQQHEATLKSKTDTLKKFAEAEIAKLPEALRERVKQAGDSPEAQLAALDLVNAALGERKDPPQGGSLPGVQPAVPPVDVKSNLSSGALLDQARGK